MSVVFSDQHGQDALSTRCLLQRENKAVAQRNEAGPRRQYITRQSLVTRKNVPERMLNLLTGVKLGTYDTEKYRALDEAQAIADYLASDPHVHQGVYDFIPGKYQDQVTQEEKQMLVRKRQLEKLAFGNMKRG